ncbi:FHA domain-containing protein [Microbulbifer sp. TYP-18]|uniref:FHA domain-containing protein n=1 Tax=Microbulbifer sp. TYP-18 TaxID=3230024 RepID=UPI0034C6AD9A
MALIIEELNRANRVRARYRMEGDRFTLGRGYQNDAIIEDLHADTAHAEILRDENGRYHLRDLDSVNGIQLLRNSRGRPVSYHQIENERVIESGDEIQVGKTHLRLIDSNTPLPPAVPVHSLENILHQLSNPMVAIALLLAMGGSALLLSYLGYARAYEWTLALNLVAGTLLGILLYAAAWAFIGRVVRHDSQFFTHLTIAALGALLYTLWEWFGSLLDYNYALGRLALPLLNFAVLAVLLPTMLWCACYLATNISPRWRLGVALVLPLGFLGLGLSEQITSLSKFHRVPQISTEIKYKSLLWRKPEPLQPFIAGTRTLFDIPVEEREQEPPSDQSDEAEAGTGDSARRAAPNHVAGAAP